MEIDQLLDQAGALAPKIFDFPRKDHEPQEGYDTKPDIYFSAPALEKNFPVRDAYLLVMLRRIEGWKPAAADVTMLETRLRMDAAVVRQNASSEYGIALPPGLLLFDAPLNVSQLSRFAPGLTRLFYHARERGFKYNPLKGVLRECKFEPNKVHEQYRNPNAFSLGALPQLRNP